MARFPRREADIRILVQNIIAGLTDNPDFPNPPVTPTQLQTLLDNSIALEETQVAALAASQQATEAKQAGNDKMISAAKSVLNYAEDTVDGNDAKLAALGWSGRAEPTPLQAPGQPRMLETPKKGRAGFFWTGRNPRTAANRPFTGLNDGNRLPRNG
ncbi:hypothetical protein [Candidatus Electrothrix sp.]|uniref:hypothetical protein n=1 Tax=Candidatus Electrothrix sp. TaxID=2170559 RepID=UPI0040565F24